VFIAGSGEEGPEAGVAVDVAIGEDVAVRGPGAATREDVPVRGAAPEDAGRADEAWRVEDATADVEEVPVRREEDATSDDDEAPVVRVEDATSDDDWANDAAAMSNTLARIGSFFIYYFVF